MDRATVHFAHATGFNAGTYRQLIEALDPSFDVYAMDARGHGFSNAPADPRSLRSWRCLLYTSDAADDRPRV